MSKSPTRTPASIGNVADQVAEFIGRTMGELLNRKQGLTKQMAEVDRQIAEVRQRVVRQFGEYLPGREKPARASRTRSRTAKTADGGSARVVSPETRRKMADAARKRWARERSKPKSAKKAR